MLVEEFVAQAAIKTLDAGILIRLAWLNQAQLHASLVGPRHHHLAAELLTVFGPEHLRHASGQCQPIQHLCDAVTRAGNGSFTNAQMLATSSAGIQGAGCLRKQPSRLAETWLLARRALT